MTNQLERPKARPPATDAELRRGWFAVVLIPVFLVVAFALGYVLYDLLGYKPENNDAPVWADVAVAAFTLAVSLIPCAGAAIFGSRTRRAGDRRGFFPFVIGALAAVALTVLTVVTTVADAVG